MVAAPSSRTSPCCHAQCLVRGVSFVSSVASFIAVLPRLATPSVLSVASLSSRPLPRTSPCLVRGGSFVSSVASYVAVSPRPVSCPWRLLRQLLVRRRLVRCSSPCRHASPRHVQCLVRGGFFVSSVASYIAVSCPWRLLRLVCCLVHRRVATPRHTECLVRGGSFVSSVASYVASLCRLAQCLVRGGSFGSSVALCCIAVPSVLSCPHYPCRLDDFDSLWSLH